MKRPHKPEPVSDKPDEINAKCADCGIIAPDDPEVWRRLDKSGCPPELLEQQLANPRRSVLQDWVMELPIREQGTLLTGVRGCDLTPKFPLDSTERQLVGFLRWCFMVPADPREIDSEPGCFFISKPPELWKASELGHYPQHWVSHLMHCFEVIMHRHPDRKVGDQAQDIYMKIVRSLHLQRETFVQYYDRLSEDRIASGEIVS